MRLAVVGCGRIANYHARAAKKLADTCSLAAAVDLNKKVAGLFMEKYGCDRVFDDMEKAARSESFDAAIICLPHALLAEAAELFVRHGKHVLLEKPCATVATAARYFSAMREAEKRGVVLLPAFVNRFTGNFMEAKKLLSEGAVGGVIQAYSVNAGFLRELQTPWWASAGTAGGFWLTLIGTHVIDRMLWLQDGSPESVFASYRAAGPLVEGETEGVLTFTTADGVCNTILFSNNCRAPVNDFKIIGTAATLSVSDRVYLNGEPLEKGGASNDMFAAQLMHFIDAVAGKVKPVVTAASGADVLRILQAASISNREKRAVAITEVKQ